MRTVYSKTELERALTSGEKHIIAKGEIAKELRKKNNLKKAAKIGGILLAIGGIAAAPFTGGASLIPSIAAAGATATITITTAELAILCGTSVALAAILTGRKVKLKFKDDGSVELDVE
ncbi:MAG: hypothetical protein K5685_07455 [Bacteroidales bacterium]|nr:hypothetical protein [Bacteroidales bacterium]